MDHSTGLRETHLTGTTKSSDTKPLGHVQLCLRMTGGLGEKDVLNNGGCTKQGCARRGGDPSFSETTPLEGWEKIVGAARTFFFGRSGHMNFLDIVGNAYAHLGPLFPVHPEPRDEVPKRGESK